MLRKLSVLMTVLAVGAFGFGCNTMEGVGEDVQWTGEQIQTGADQLRR